MIRMRKLPFELSQLICMNAAGQRVSVTYDHVGMDDMSQYALHVAHLPSGVYTLEFIGENGVKASAKLIK